MASNGISFRETLSKPGLLKEIRACFDLTQDGVSSRFGRGPANCDALARTVGPQGAGPYRICPQAPHCNVTGSCACCPARYESGPIPLVGN